MLFILNFIYNCVLNIGFVETKFFFFSAVYFISQQFFKKLLLKVFLKFIYFLNYNCKNYTLVFTTVSSQILFCCTTCSRICFAPLFSPHLFPWFAFGFHKSIYNENSCYSLPDLLLHLWCTAGKLRSLFLENLCLIPHHLL